MTIERDETTATKLASVSQRLEAVEVRDASITCAHKNAHRALSDLEDLNERVMALAEAVGDVDRVTETALGELIAVAGKTATDVTELAKVTADEIAGERRKREELERAVNALRAKVRSVAQWEPVPKEDLQRVWRAMAEVRSNRDDTHILATSTAGTQRYQGRQIEELRGRLNGQDEQILKLCRDVADIRAYQEETREGLDGALEAHDHGQPADGMDGNPTDGYARRDMIKWNQFQGEAITAQGERIRALERAVVASADATINGMDKLTKRIDGIEATMAALEEHEHPEINFGEQVGHLDGSVYGMGQRIDGAERLAHKRMDNLAARITELERRAR